MLRKLYIELARMGRGSRVYDVSPSGERTQIDGVRAIRISAGVHEATVVHLELIGVEVEGEITLNDDDLETSIPQPTEEHTRMDVPDAHEPSVTVGRASDTIRRSLPRVRLLNGSVPMGTYAGERLTLPEGEFVWNGALWEMIEEGRSPQMERSWAGSNAFDYATIACGSMARSSDIPLVAQSASRRRDGRSSSSR